MKLWADYTDYLKNNPKGYWFRRKLYGYGSTPAHLPGCLTLALVCLFLNKVEEIRTLREINKKIIIPLVLLTVLLIFVSYLKGEPPLWQWVLRDVPNVAK